MTDSLDAKHGAIADEIQKVIEETTGHKIPSHETPLASVGFDSITMLDLLSNLENRFGVGLNENIIHEFRTIQRIARIISEAQST